MSDGESIEGMIDGGWAWAPTRSLADLPAPLDNDGEPRPPVAPCEPGMRAPAGLTVISVTPEVAARARLLGPAELRTLDAIHLATALEVGGELPFCRDDRRLADAAVGLRVVHPGA